MDRGDSAACPDSSERTSETRVDQTALSTESNLPYAKLVCGSDCTHYQRRCAFVTPCCKKIYTCRVCHNENETHEVDRHAVVEIVCLLCGTKQPVDRLCAHCGVEFGRYFCPICRLYDDNDSQQFHCDLCGICRLGGRENFFHCTKCDTCLGIEIKETHKCLESRMHTNCPVCLEDLHSSRVGLYCLPCNHLTHKQCWIELLKSGNYACPVCCHSMIDMTEQWKLLDSEVEASVMPDELKDARVWILCRDCHKVSEIAFHYIGLKCCECGSYNTCRTDGDESHNVFRTAGDGAEPGGASSSAEPSQQ